MTDGSSDKRHPAWHPLPATKKHHEFIQAQHDLAHAAATERNKAHNERMQELRTNPSEQQQTE